MNKRKKIEENEHREEIEIIVNKSREILIGQGKKRLLSFQEFIYVQARQIKKRWWLFQVILLFVLGLFIESNQDIYYIDRCLGIAGALFVIFLVPELWKNSQYKCMEIEMSSFFSIRQIYAARILVLGVVDILMLLLFGIIAYCVWGMSFNSIIFQFLLPMVVTACICFKALEKQKVFNSTLTVALCFIWCALWWGITSIEIVYEKIMFPILCAILIASVFFLLMTINRFLKNCSDFWEDSSNGISSK